jgi:hypothetical protein
MTTRRQPPAWVLGLVIVTIAFVLLLLHARRYYPFITDDAFISLRYAARLIDGKGLNWNDGERVEGYSNLLWVLSCAGLGALGMDLIAAARVLGVAGMTAVFAALVYRYDALVSLVACLFLVSSGPIAAWAIGGLEQPLVAGLLAWAIVTSLPLLERQSPRPRDFALPGLLFGLLAITRPDGVLFAAAAVFVFLTASRNSRLPAPDSALPSVRYLAWRNALRLATIPLLFLAGQTLLRLTYYGDWLPNTAHAKLAPSSVHFWVGVTYLRMGTAYLRGILFPAAVGLVVCAWLPALRRRAYFLALPIALWAAYVAMIGGDIFLGRRHFVPILVLSAFALAEGFMAIMHQRRAVVRAVACVVCAACLAVLVKDQLEDPKNLNLIHERFEWDSQVIGRLLQRGFGEQQPLLAVEAAGALPYFAQLPALDLFGLNDRYLAHHPPASYGEGRIGHELGDGRYALARQPDLIVFCWAQGGPTACSLSGTEMQADSRFAEEYVKVWFRGTDPYPFDSQFFVRLYSPRIGVRRQDSLAVVPGWVFSNGELPVSLNAGGKLAVLAPPIGAVHRTGIALPEGRWRLRGAAQSPYRILISAHDNHHPYQPDEAVDGRIDIEIRAIASVAHVDELVFEPVEDSGVGKAVGSDPSG